MYPYPTKYRFLKFMLFNGEGSISAMELITRFICHCKEAVDLKFLKLRLFLNSLTERALTCYINLSSNSVQN